MNLNPSEISDLIKSRIQNLQLGATARNEGTVVSVTDGICRVHGLVDVLQGEMLEFPRNNLGLAVDPERDTQLRMLDARHLFEVNLTRLAIRRGTWLRGFAYGFIETFAPTLTREAVDKALAGPHLSEHFSDGAGV